MILLYILIVLISAFIALSFLSETRAIEVFAEITRDSYPKQARKIPLGVLSSLRFHKIDPDKNTSLMKVNGNCLRPADIYNKDLLLVRTLDSAKWEIKNNELFVNGMKLDVSNTFLFFNHWNNPVKNAKFNFKVRKFHKFEVQDGKIIIYSGKCDKKGKWEYADHEASKVLGILERNITRRNTYLRIAS